MKTHSSTERIIRSTLTDQAPYRVSLLPAIGSEERARRINAIFRELQTERPLCDTHESMQFITHPPCRSDRVLHQLHEFLTQPVGHATIVVGDELVEAADNGYKPSNLAQQVRSVFLDQAHVRAVNQCGLIALVPGTPMRTRDVDSVVDTTRLATASLDEAIQRTANGLWLKSRHARSSLVEGDERNRGAIQVQIVQSEQQLRECFQLRHRVYDWLGYLDDELSRSDSKLEMDPFDKASLHFVAIDPRSNEVAGTMRLVTASVPTMLRRTAIGEPGRIMAAQKQWCKSIAQQATDAVVRQRLQSHVRLPLPILQNSNFGDRWPEFLRENRARQGGEISRVVVSPRYRGLGISTLLLRAGIATACELKKTYLLLECIPGHAAMYRKNGFQLLRGHHCRAQGLDQIAVGMRLDLDDSPYNAPVRLAARDIVTMRSAYESDTSRDQLDKGAALRHAFCLCDLRPCWKDGHYALRGEESCPLSRLSGNESSSG